jgi:hypothetical protein
MQRTYRGWRIERNGDYYAATKPGYLCQFGPRGVVADDNGLRVSSFTLEGVKLLVDRKERG